MDIRKGRHVVYAMHAHLVFVTKRRGKVFNKKHLDYLKTIFTTICGKFECEIIEFNGEPDHIHLLLNYPPKVTIAELVNILKGVSSRRFKQEFPEMENFWSIKKSKNALWSPSYFAGSVGGAPLSILRQYIENQNT